MSMPGPGSAGPGTGPRSDPPGGRQLAVVVTIIGLIGSVLGILTWFGIEWADDKDAPSPTPTWTASPPPADDTSTAAAVPASTGPTHAEYVAAADDVCLRWFSTLPTGPARDLTEAIENTSEIQQIYQNAINEWQSLQPPSGERAAADEIIDLNYEFLHELEDAGDAFRQTGDPSYFDDIGEAGSVVPRLRRLSQEFGLRICTPPSF